MCRYWFLSVAYCTWMVYDLDTCNKWDLVKGLCHGMVWAFLKGLGKSCVLFFMFFYFSDSPTNFYRRNLFLPVNAKRGNGCFCPNLQTATRLKDRRVTESFSGISVKIPERIAFYRFESKPLFIIKNKQHTWRGGQNILATKKNTFESLTTTYIPVHLESRIFTEFTST